MGYSSNLEISHESRYICMYKGLAIKSIPCTATFNDLLCLWVQVTCHHKEVVRMWSCSVLNHLSNTWCRHVGNGGIAPLFLTSALNGGEWSASCPGRFNNRNRAPSTNRIGRVGLGDGMYGHCGVENSLTLDRNRNLTVQPTIGYKTLYSTSSADRFFGKMAGCCEHVNA
jgi:hypothetical protein